MDISCDFGILETFNNRKLLELAARYLRIYDIMKEIFNQRIIDNPEGKAQKILPPFKFQKPRTPPISLKSEAYNRLTKELKENPNLINYISRNKSGKIIGASVVRKKADQLLDEGNTYLPEFNLIGEPDDLKEFLLSEGLNQKEVDEITATSELP